MRTKTQESSKKDFTILEKLTQSVEQVACTVQSFCEMYACGDISKKDIPKINKQFSNDFLQHTIQGHGLRKPQGYAGDYLMIDKILTEHISEKEEFRAWDIYFHMQSAPKAVRNRKEYIKHIIDKKVSSNGALKMLKLASGPCRDIFETFNLLDKPERLNVTCVDGDQDAIDFGKKLNQPYLNYIDFIKANVVRFNTEEKFDLIWSAGLFDYFNDRTFIFFLKRFKQWINKGGEIIIGNFNENNNPSRAYMEIFGEWFLIHRTKDQLRNIAIQAGYTNEQINIGVEPEGANLFLHITI